ncbi:hypothetical protein AAG570_007570 [Ranatra chinensis]|uniref:Uncharacterized protein n=1 Tax=Ranatra chinensis TaxID=642074 RepID=A0ABD0XWA1_9HEMI
MAAWYFLATLLVKFFLETFKTPFVPGQVTIRTEWLSEVVERKTRLIRKIRDQWNKSRTHRPEGSRPTTAKTKLHIGPTREEMNILKNADLKIQGDESSTSSDSITTEGSSSHLAYHDSEGSESDDSSLSVFYEKRMWRSESWREECLRHRVHEGTLRRTWVVELHSYFIQLSRGYPRSLLYT